MSGRTGTAFHAEHTIVRQPDSSSWVTRLRMTEAELITAEADAQASAQKFRLTTKSAVLRGKGHQPAAKVRINGVDTARTDWKPNQLLAHDIEALRLTTREADAQANAQKSRLGTKPSNMRSNGRETTAKVQKHVADTEYTDWRPNQLLVHDLNWQTSVAPIEKHVQWAAEEDLATAESADESSIKEVGDGTPVAATASASKLQAMRSYITSPISIVPEVGPRRPTWLPNQFDRSATKRLVQQTEEKDIFGSLKASPADAEEALDAIDDFWVSSPRHSPHLDAVSPPDKAEALSLDEQDDMQITILTLQQQLTTTDNKLSSVTAGRQAQLAAKQQLLQASLDDSTQLRAQLIKSKAHLMQLDWILYLLLLS